MSQAELLDFAMRACFHFHAANTSITGIAVAYWLIPQRPRRLQARFTSCDGHVTARARLRDCDDVLLSRKREKPQRMRTLTSSQGAAFWQGPACRSGLLAQLRGAATVNASQLLPFPGCQARKRRSRPRSTVRQSGRDRGNQALWR